MTERQRRGVVVPPTLDTLRLRLRRWRDTDLAPFAQLNADPEVMQFMPGRLTSSESDAFVTDRIVSHFDMYGYGLWAVERRDTADFIGFVGHLWQTFEAPFTPALEVGWRLGRTHWGNGFATEAAAEALRVAFDDLSETEVVSMTVPMNHRSTAVMGRLGMTRDPRDDFDHPRLPPGHRYRRHVLYRITADDWQRQPRG